MQLGKYKIIEELGRGGFGVVYKARELTLERDVAIKVLHPQLAADVEFVERFRKEARSLAWLEHSNIVPIYEFSQVDGRYFIAMRHLGGGSLAQLITLKGVLELAEVLRITRQVISGLSYAHAQGMVHCDIKPNNILFDSQGNAMITDFGLTRAAQTSRSASTSIAIGGVGTPEYMAPEMWELKSVDPAADQYSLACVICEMLTGNKLFEGETTPIIMLKHFKPLILPDTLPSFLHPILQKTLAMQPQERYGTLAEMLLEIEKVLGASTGGGTKVDPVQERLAKVQALLKTRDFEAAFPEIEDLYKIAPKETAPLYTHALILRGDQKFQAGSLEDSLKDYRAASEIAPAGKHGDELDKAIKKVEDAINTRSLENAEELLRQGKVEAAVARLEEMYHASPRTTAGLYVKALLERGRIRQQKGDLIGAAHDYQKGLSLLPEGQTRAELNSALAQLRHQEGIQKVKTGERLLSEHQIEQAVGKLGEAYKIVPDQAAEAYAQALFKRGSQRQTAGDQKSALEDYRKAIQIAPEGGFKEEIRLAINALRSQKKKRLPNWLIVLIVIIGIIVLFWNLPRIGDMLFAPPPSTATSPSGGDGNNNTETEGLVLSTTENAEFITMRINAQDGWHSTPITVTKGNPLTVSYESGLWSPYDGLSIDGQGDLGSSFEDPGNIIFSCHHGALIGKIEENPPFCIENSFSEIAQQTGRLYLTINDNRPEDDSGYIIVSITDNSVSQEIINQNTLHNNTEKALAPFLVAQQAWEGDRMHVFSDFFEDPAPTPGYVTFEYEAIYLKKYDASSNSTTPKRISDLGGCRDPVISPDGNRVAYIRETLNPRSSWIMIRDLTSNQQQEIKGVFSPAGVNGLTWSPDGQKLAFLDAFTWHVVILDISTGTVSEIINERGQDVCFSPDGTRIAFMLRIGSDQNDDDGWILVIYNLITKTSVTVTEINDMRGLFGPFYWTPTGEYLLFQSFSLDEEGNRGAFELWKVQADGNNPERTVDSWEILDQAFFPWFRTISEGHFYIFE